MVDFLDDEEFAGLKYTLYNSGGNEDWKLDFIEFLEEETDASGKEYFYYMMPCIRFIVDPKSIAYTTPQSAICLSAPHDDVKTTMPNWYFIYLHECLHQMWDTFGAADEIRDKLGECDEYILNIASDCVINDFLNTNIHFKLKYPTDGLVTPRSIKDDYGVIFDKRTDTQVSLYEKLIEAKDKIYKQPPQGYDPPKIDKKSDEYVKGWNQAMADYAAGKINI